MRPRVGRDTCNPVRRWGDHPPSLSTPQRPIANQYREGKVKSTPTRGVKQFLKPDAYKQSEGESLTAYLLYNGSASWPVEQA